LFFARPRKVTKRKAAPVAAPRNTSAVPCAPRTSRSRAELAEREHPALRARHRLAQSRGLPSGARLARRGGNGSANYACFQNIVLSTSYNSASRSDPNPAARKPRIFLLRAPSNSTKGNVQRKPPIISRNSNSDKRTKYT